MSRLYADQIAVTATATADGLYPREFRWRGGRYRVQHVLARWIEASPWWRDAAYQVSGRRQVGHRGADQQKTSQQRAYERLVWRVEAAGPARRLGVYDLCNTDGGSSSNEAPGQQPAWYLVRALD